MQEDDGLVLTVSETPIDGKYRILGADGQIAERSDTGQPMDYGGQEDRNKLVRMAGHIMDGANKKREQE